MNNSLIKISTVGAIVLIAGTVATKSTYAFWPFDDTSKTTSESTQTTSTPTLLDRIIEKFSLNKTEVETVINNFRDEKQTQMQALFEEKLTAAVKNGELTEVQKQLILAKHTELVKQNEVDNTNRQARRAELESWATQNGIDLKYFNEGRGMGRGKGIGVGERRGMGRGMGW